MKDGKFLARWHKCENELQVSCLVVEVVTRKIYSRTHLFCLDFLIRGTDLMMHPDLEIDVEFLGPLLSPKVEQELMDT